MGKEASDRSSAALAEQPGSVKESGVLREPLSTSEEVLGAKPARACAQPQENLVEAEPPPSKDAVPERAASHDAASTSERMPVRADEAAAPGQVHAPAPAADPGREGLRLARMWVYPIKSCAGFEPVASWPLGPNGLLLDREWALVDAEGAALTLKRVPKLATLRPVLDLQAGTARSPHSAVFGVFWCRGEGRRPRASSSACRTHNELFWDMRCSQRCPCTGCCCTNMGGCDQLMLRLRRAGALHL